MIEQPSALADWSAGWAAYENMHVGRSSHWKMHVGRSSLCDERVQCAIDRKLGFTKYQRTRVRPCTQLRAELLDLAYNSVLVRM